MLSSPLRGKGGVGLSVLRSAAEDLVEDWSDGSESLLQAPEGVAPMVQELVGAVEAYCEDEDSSVVVGEVPDRHLLHRLVEELLARVLGHWRDGEASYDPSEESEILRVCWCLEMIRRKLWPKGEEDLGLRFSGPDTFELLVEVAHDMRSPLSSILFLAETLRAARSGEVNELQRRQLGLIYSAALGLMSMTNDVVDAAKEGRGLLDEEPSPFSLGEVFDSIHELVRPVAEEKGLDLRLDRPDRDRFVGHAMALNRVLLNLTTNALKFTEEGGVSVSAERIDRTTLEFSVTDTGRGMDEDKIQGLFQPFQKSEYRSGHFFSNSGLGLSIARRLLSSMGAELEVESEVGEGTRFFFRVELPDASTY